MVTMTSFIHNNNPVRTADRYRQKVTDLGK